MRYLFYVQLTFVNHPSLKPLEREAYSGALLLLEPKAFRPQQNRPPDTTHLP